MSKKEENTNYLLLLLGTGFLYALTRTAKPKPDGSVSVELPAGGYPIYPGDCDQPNTNNWISQAVSRLNQLIADHNEQVRRDRRAGVTNPGPLLTRVNNNACWTNEAADAWEFLTGTRAAFIDVSTGSLNPIF